MKYILISLFFFNISIICHSQQKSYIDIDNKQIDSTKYSKRCESYIYKCIEYKLDSISLNKILYKFSFGKISQKKTNQLLKLFSLDSKKDITGEHIILIKYFDSIYNYQTLKKGYNKHIASHKEKKTGIIINKQTRIWHRPYNERIYNKDNKKWIKTCNKCVKKFEKVDNVKALFYYGYAQENAYKYDSLNFVKDRSVIKNTFFKIIRNFRTLILKPNGEYFLNGGHLNDKKIKEILKTNDWSKLKKDWETSINKYPNSGYGFFKKPISHERHCF